MFTITAYLGVKVIMYISQIKLTLYITLSRAKPHYIRFPKFTYVDGKFLGELGGLGIHWMGGSGESDN
ncbi:hypothetical protein HHA03_16320 [Halolactibacillus halophilus]|uniref:Uncharacterized protein n=1 Tax=Halolactibacillus halophilus TaxID=306540 RepID=A0ABQ0VNS5_9BACI|nr:hypothetical protein HHA03_16320 [Halolactibacillus halophilus]